MPLHMLLVKYINIGACFKGQKAGIAAGYLTGPSPEHAILQHFTSCHSSAMDRTYSKIEAMYQ